MCSYKIALAGQPNTGKSTVFNKLTGLRQHVGNWPGKTVEQKSGNYKHNNINYTVIDLPGTYSLTANSVEETIARDYIILEEPDVVVVLVDASQLERTMYLLAEVASLDSNVIVALNMMDVAEQEGISIDVNGLSKSVGIPVVPLVAAKNEGVDKLKQQIQDSIQKRPNKSVHVETGLSEGVLETISKYLEGKIDNAYSQRWVSTKLLEEDALVKSLVQKNVSSDSWNSIQSIISESELGALEIASSRYKWIQSVLDGNLTRSREDKVGIRRGRFDKYATHPFYGVPVAILVILGTFVLSFLPALPFMSIMFVAPSIINSVRNTLASSPAWVAAMIADGIVPGLIMGIAFFGYMLGVFFAVGLVEDVGYMARVAFIADRFMNRVGLHGKSFFPIFASLGCNVAGVLGSRVVDSSKQRLMTIIMSPIVPCMAVWGITGFFGALFFGTYSSVITIILMLSLIFWLTITGKILEKRIEGTDQGGLIMEIPPYHKPNWNTIGRFVWVNAKSFIKKGVTLVAMASLFIWALSYLPNGDIETSILASLGKTFEPFGALMGFDWKMMVALIASMVSKESALTTIGILYGVSAGAGGSSLTGLVLGVDPIDHALVTNIITSSISPASALSFIFAIFYSVPCLGTVGALWSESKSIKWSIFATLYYIGTTILVGILAYRIGLFIL
jgi:ferrous iron transport protein B